MKQKLQALNDEKALRIAGERVAVKTPDHLKQWLRETGRTTLIFNALDLVDALPWPSGVEALINIINCYQQHRIPKDKSDLPTQEELADLIPRLQARLNG